MKTFQNNTSNHKPRNALVDHTVFILSYSQQITLQCYIVFDIYSKHFSTDNTMNVANKDKRNDLQQ